MQKSYACGFATLRDKPDDFVKAVITFPEQ